MRVVIKRLGIDMTVKSRGIEFEIRTPDNTKQVGDVVLSMSGVTWCRGRTIPENGKKMSWEQFIEMMESRQ